MYAEKPEKELNTSITIYTNDDVTITSRAIIAKKAHCLSTSFPGLLAFLMSGIYKKRQEALLGTRLVVCFIRTYNRGQNILGQLRKTVFFW